jgi:DNA-binding CsgD family transcriptional regulator
MQVSRETNCVPCETKLRKEPLTDREKKILFLHAQGIQTEEIRTIQIRRTLT